MAGDVESAPTVAVQMEVGRRRALGIDSEQNVIKFICQILWEEGNTLAIVQFLSRGVAAPRKQLPPKTRGDVTF